MTDYIWLIGGSIMSLPMIKEIKARGYRLLLTDKNEACAGRPYADEFEPASVYDEQAHRDLAHGRVNRPAAILCIGCDAGPTVAMLSDYFGLLSVGYETARLVKDKYRLREKLGFAHPKQYQGLEEVVYPCALKARNLSGSRGFRVVRKPGELNDLLQSDGFLIGDSFLEELLEGEDLIPEWRERYGFDTSEAAFDFFVMGGEIYYVNGALRMFWRDRPGIEAGHINPFLPGQAVLELARQAVQRLGVSWGIFKLDMKLDRHWGWCILEGATRMSGGFDHMYTAQLARGKNVTGAVLDFVMGRPTWADKLQEKRDGYACAYAPRFPAGVIGEWSRGEGEESKKGQDDEREGYVFPLVKGRIMPLNSNQDRPLFVLRRGETMEAALQAAVMEAVVWKCS